MWRFCLAAVFAAALSGCALRPAMTPQVADTRGYAQLIRLAPALMQARHLADADLSFHSAGRPKGGWGQTMFRMVSPDFLFGEDGHDVYLGETFRGTRTPMSREYFDADGYGFFIVHPTQRLSLRLLARVDWNGDGAWDWLMRCTVETFRGSRVRHYYVLAPEPAAAGQMTHGVIMAAVDEMGLARPLVALRDISSYGKDADAAPPTEVKEGLPGDFRVTEPPSAARPAGGVQERDI